MMSRVIDYAIAHARLTVATLVFLLAAGMVAYLTIAKEAEPDVRIPIIYVQLSQRGISPEDSEQLLLRPVEAQLLVDPLVGGGVVVVAEDGDHRIGRQDPADDEGERQEAHERRQRRADDADGTPAAAAEEPFGSPARRHGGAGHGSPLCRLVGPIRPWSPDPSASSSSDGRRCP